MAAHPIQLVPIPCPRVMNPDRPTAETDAIAAEVIKNWTDALLESRTKDVVALYASDALFYGSSPEISVGTKGVAGYFESIPDGAVKKVRFFDTHIARPANNVIIAGAFVDFHVDFDDGVEVLEFRIMLTLLRNTAGTWKIAGHHAGSRTR